jgi:hypothetical protein
METTLIQIQKKCHGIVCHYKLLFFPQKIEENSDQSFAMRFVQDGVARWNVSKPKNPNVGKFWKVLQW